MKSLVNMVTREPDKTVKPVMGHVFKKGRRTWEVTAVTKNFVIATATNAITVNHEEDNVGNNREFTGLPT